MHDNRNFGRHHLARVFVAALGALLGAAALTGGSASAAPAEKVLYSFCQRSRCTDGGQPAAGLIADSKGNLYGTTSRGGASAAGYGTVFKLSPRGTLTVLHSFSGYPSDGQIPYAGLIADSKGNLYGTTSQGGTSAYGTVFKLSPGGTYTVLHSFSGGLSDGVYPYAGLISDSSGNVYGTTSGAGAHNSGAVFKLSPGGTYTVLYSFCNLSNCSDGGGPKAGLIADSSGNLYGTTEYGGKYSYGTVFKLSPGGTYTVLYSFCSLSNCSDGTSPVAGLIADNKGNLYGTA